MFKGNEQKLTKEMEIGLNMKVMLEKYKHKETEKEKSKIDRVNDLERMKQSGMEAHKNIIYPKYVYEDRIKI